MTDHTQSRTNVRRSNVTACLRCKQRKQRCDQHLPACSNCARAGAECLSADPAGHAISRRYVRDLEDRVAALQKELLAASAPTAIPPALDAPQPMSPYDGKAQFSPQQDSSAIQEPVKFDLKLPSLEALTKAEAQSITDVYFQHSNFFSPILVRSRFEETLNNHFGNGSGLVAPDPKAVFQIYMVLAIAIRLRNCTDPGVSVSQAGQYFGTAKAIHGELTDIFWADDLDQLESLLLVVQYTMFASDLGECLRHLGMAARLSIRLQLNLPQRDDNLIEDHDHGPWSADHDNFPRRLWLFWATYNFERNIGPVLNAPMIILDSTIQVPLPPNDFNDHVQALAIHVLRHRLLESQIMLYRSELVKAGRFSSELHEWRSQIRSELIQWREQCPAFIQPTTLVPPETFQGLFRVAIVRLYSLSSAAPGPSDSDVLFLAENAIKSIGLYRKSFKAGRLRFFWRTLHNIHLCGTSLVQCYRWAVSRAKSGDYLEELKHWMTVCSAVLWGMAERYPAGVRFRDEFDDLVASLPRNRFPVDYMDALHVDENIQWEDVLSGLLEDNITAHA